MASNTDRPGGVSDSAVTNKTNVHRLWADVLLLPAFSLILGFVLLYLKSLSGWDQLVYDWQLKSWPRQPSDDIIIISVDERSLQELGRWPWSRTIHSELLDRLTAADAKVVGMDIVFAEEDKEKPDSDLALINAVETNARVVLPILMEQARIGGQLLETLPLPGLIRASAGLGHVDHPLDSDAVVRGVYLQGGIGETRWPSFALSMLEIAENTRIEDLPGLKANLRTSITSDNGTPITWHRNHYILVPFAGPPGSYLHASYIDVLNNTVPLEEFQDKVVIVGATAAGLGDVMPTPVSGNHNPMPGVEVIANEFDVLRSKLAITPLSLPWHVIITALLVVIPPVLYPRIRPRWSLLVCAGFVALAIGLSFLMLSGPRYWFQPSTAVVVLVLVYILWTWRRLVQTVSYLNQELKRLDAEPAMIEHRPEADLLLQKAMPLMKELLPIDGCVLRTPDGLRKLSWGQEPSKTVHSIVKGEWSGNPPSLWTRVDRDGDAWQFGVKWTGEDTPDEAAKNILLTLTQRLALEPQTKGRGPIEFIQSRIERVRAASQRLQDLRRFVSNTLERMADGVIVADALGNILVMNAQAALYAGQKDANYWIGKSVMDLLKVSKLSSSESLRDVLSSVLLENHTVQLPLTRENKQHLLLHLVPFEFETEPAKGVLVNISDVTELTQTERQRRELLDFLSHDLRAPLTSILALTEVSKLKPDQPVGMEKIVRIEGNARSTLDLVDNVLGLTKAEQLEQTAFSDVDLAALAYKALESVSAQAEIKQIDLLHHLPDEVLVNGDEGLLQRVWINLLSNAIKYSPEQTTVTLGIDVETAYVLCWVEDTGFGIPPEDIDRLFNRFERVDLPQHNEQVGTGLGLVFIKTVAERHGGHVDVKSELGEGSRFTFYIPVPP